MNIIIQCDQIGCTFNTTLTKELYLLGLCKHPAPMIQTTFGKNISSETRVCHSKDIKFDPLKITKVSPCSTCECPEPEYCLNCCPLDLKHKKEE